MKAIGRDHPTRELAGLRHTTTATDIMRGTGRETGAESNTITTRITIETATFTITTDMVIMTTAGTIDSEKGLEDTYCPCGGTQLRRAAKHLSSKLRPIRCRVGRPMSGRLFLCDALVEFLSRDSAKGNHEAIDADFRRSEFHPCETGIL